MSGKRPARFPVAAATLFLLTAAAAARADYRSDILATTGLVSYWRLGETSGTVIADERGVNAGTLSGSPTLNLAGTLAGDANPAMGFDNGGNQQDLVNVPHTPSLALTSYSIEFWAYFDSLGVTARQREFITKDNGGPIRQFMIGFPAGSTVMELNFDYVSDTYFFIQLPGTPTLGTWRHYVFTVEASQKVDIWVDGVLAATKPLAGVPESNTSELALGTRNSLGGLGVRLDEVAIYDRALPSNVIQAHHNAGRDSARFAFTTPARTLPANLCGGAANVITVELQSASGTPRLAPPGGRSFTASSNTTGTASWFTNATCGTPAPGGVFTVPAGASSVDLYYRDTQPGFPALSLSNTVGLTNPTPQTQTVIGPAALQDDFESGTLLSSANPPGRWSSMVSEANVTTTASMSAARRGSWGLRVVDGSSLAGSGPESELNFNVPNPTGSFYLRTWVRLSSVNNLGAPFLFAVAATPLSPPNILEAIVRFPGAAVELQGKENGSGFEQTPTGVNLTLGSWHLLEAAATGVGTNAGARRLWIDGELRATDTGNDWTGLSVSAFRTGEHWSDDRRFTGNIDYDDWRIASTPHASRLSLGFPAGTLATGDCLAVQLDLRDSVSNALAPAPYPVTVGLSSSVNSDELHATAACNSPLTSRLIDAGTTSTTVYFRASTPGSRTVTAAHLDFLPGTATPSLGGGGPVLPAARLAFTTPPRTFAANTCPGDAGAIRVQLEDANGLPVNAAAGGVSFTAQSDSTGASSWFTDASCSTPAPGGAFTVPTGESSVELFYVDPSVGAPTVSLSTTSGLALPAGQTHTVRADTGPPGSSDGPGGPAGEVDDEEAAMALALNLGCGCAAQGGADAVAVGLTWFLLLCARRRRRRH